MVVNYKLFASQMSLIIFKLVFNTFVHKEDLLSKKNSRKSWVFVTNVPNDLSPSVYLDLFASHV